MHPEHFKSTNWSLVERARQGDSKALNELISIYRPPLVGFFQAQGVRPEAAEDLAQETFIRFLTRRIAEGAGREFGRFRALLAGVAKNILREQTRRNRTEKRGGRVQFVPLEDERVSVSGAAESTASDLQEAFDREWASHLVSLALRRLSNEGGPPYGESLRLFLEELSILQIAEALGTDAQNVKNFLRRARTRLARYVQLEIEAYCASGSEGREEAKHLSRFIGSAG
jgi:RNA polymerase sigma factor (sigma-70 family)